MAITEQQIPSRLLPSRLQEVRSRITHCCEQHRRPIPTLLAVSKTRSAADMRELVRLGVTAFGENYLQEALEKQRQLTDYDICWHFIGPIQSNKTRPIAENFQWVHSIDRIKLAKRLSAQRPSSLPPLQVCLQVNIDNEPTKSGFSTQEIIDSIAEISQLPNLTLRGLMCIPEKRDNTEDQTLPFAHLAALMAALNEQLPDDCPTLDTLSMGMSSDIEAAISEGATIIRVGTALFGPRA